MKATAPVLVAAKAAPVSHELADGGIVAKLSVSTGSVAGDVASELGATMVASAATQADIAVADQNTDGLVVQAAGGQDIDLHLVRHAPETLSDERYGLLTAILWQSLHGLWDRWTGPTFDDGAQRAWQAFRALNDDIADALLAKAPSAGAGFLIHDYQLAMVPARLRVADQGAHVLYFHHVAWPGPDSLSILPRAFIADLLTGMLGADVIAFFARRWVRNFGRCVEDFMPAASVDHHRATIRVGDHVTQLAAEPLSYSSAALTGLAPSWPAELEAWTGDRPLIVHAARSDPIKNAHRAVLALAHLLGEDRCRNARMMVRINPHRLGIASHADYLDVLAHTVARTNARFGAEYVRLLIGNDRAITFGCLARADVVMINSLVDGQNLTAFEAIEAGQRDPVLVVSPECGCYEVLGEDVIAAHPYDVLDQAEALARALGQTRRDRIAAIGRLRQRSAQFTLPRWADRQLQLLGLSQSFQPRPLPAPEALT